MRPMREWGYDVPDLAGYSVDAGTIYFDRHTGPLADAPGMRREQVGDCLAVHEHTEKTLIDVLGYSYAAAHEMATAAEHEAVRALHVDPAAYEKALAPFIKRAELQRIEKPPLDLDCHPYYEDPDAQDLKILQRLAELGVKDAQHPQVKLSHAVVQYGPGHRPEYCERCKHYKTLNGDMVIPACHLVVDPISPKGWCRLWQKK